MADKMFDRAFSKALSRQKRAFEKSDEERPLTEEQKQTIENERLRKESQPMTVEDAIKRMLLADIDKDYFRLLELPPPSLDALGRPSWPCDSSDISKAYRKLSSLVHPDKNSGKDARDAFEALNKAHRELKDPGSRENALQKHLEKARKDQAKLEAEATPEERQILIANKRLEAKLLQNQEAEKYKQEVLQQRQRLQDRAKRKREKEERANKRRELEDLSDFDGEDEEDTRQAQKAKNPLDRRKGKPKLIF